MMNQLLPGLRITLLLTVLTGVIYPALVTGMCQLLFPARANGSLILKDGQVVGSRLIGQNFTRPEYFHPRPSAAGSDGYDASSSSGSNLGPTSQKLADRVREAVDQFRKANPEQTGPIPADLVTASASGLDPHISPAAAKAQAARVAKSRGITVPEVRTLIGTHKEGRDLGILGEPRINVLALNLALDSKFPLRR
jgi:K+-transporting ATPase ATPase C chain